MEQQANRTFMSSHFSLHHCHIYRRTPVRMKRADAQLALVKFLLLCMLLCGLPLAVLPASAAAQSAADRQPPSPAITSTSPASDHQSTAREVDRYLAKVKPLLDRYGYAAVFAAVMVEGCGVPAPGQTLLLAGSLAAADGQLHLALLLLVATAAAFLGNSVGYLLGRWGGRPLLHKFKVNEQHLQRVEGLFSRRGGGLIIVSRFLDGLRQLNGIVAGMLRMPWWVFTGYNLLGAVLWSFFWGLGPFFLDRHIYALHQFFDRFRLWIALPAVACFVLFVVYLLRRKRPAAAETS